MNFVESVCNHYVYSKNGYEANSLFPIHIETPDECPYCGKSMFSYPLTTLDIKSEVNTSLASIFLCSSCGRFIFTLCYHLEDNQYVISSIFPYYKENKPVSESVKTLSPNFVKIYNQASTAEKSGLDEICGMGYRKALEFLIKDFSIYRHPDKKENIEKISLAACIKEHCDNEKIKTLAKASAWLGNDETHYIRKHEDYNIKNLTTFIKAALTYIESELALDEAEKLLQS